MIGFLRSRLTTSQKMRLKALYLTPKREFVKRFLSYGTSGFLAALDDLGIGKGDTVMLHSSFGALSGFRGSPKEMTDTILDKIGPDGNLLMVSLPYMSSTYEYVRTLGAFDVRKTPSRMGIVSESFRRRDRVLRSFHPTHPVLALGPKAEWIVADHEECLFPCGPDSPFEKFWQLNGKIVFFNVPLATMTFFHYVEHRIKEALPFPLYRDEVFDVQSIDSSGKTKVVRTRVFSPDAVNRRRPLDLLGEVAKRGRLKQKRVGNSRLVCVSSVDVLETAIDMAKRGMIFYDLT